jgi:hypothetical protein
MYESYHGVTGYTCHVLVNGREYQTDWAYESDNLAQENAALKAYMVCTNFSANNGMLARNGVVQGLPADETSRSKRKQSSRHHVVSSNHGHSHGHGHSSRRRDHHLRRNSSDTD